MDSPCGNSEGNVYESHAVMGSEPAARHKTRQELARDRSNGGYYEYEVMEVTMSMK